MISTVDKLKPDSTKLYVKGRN